VFTTRVEGVFYYMTVVESRREHVLHNNGTFEGYSDRSEVPGNLRKQVLQKAVSSLPSYYMI
jgi:hypothetical protein